MSIEAVAAIGKQTAAQAVQQPASLAAQPAQAADAAASQGTTLSIRAQGASTMQPDGFSSQISTKVYDTIDKAKQNLLPSSDAISPVPKQAKAEGNSSLENLTKTFDHAVFMAMVNQVISGVSDTSRTLVRQQ
jgi:hypothetical protein